MESLLFRNLHAYNMQHIMRNNSFQMNIEIITLKEILFFCKSNPFFLSLVPEPADNLFSR